MNHCISTDSLTDRTMEQEFEVIMDETNGNTMEQEFEVIMDETNGNILLDSRLYSCDCGCIVVLD
jgi:hypothetical protein